jgi:hypothetical protein
MEKKTIINFNFKTMTIIMYPQIRKLCNKEEKIYALFICIFLDLSILTCLLNPIM